MVPMVIELKRQAGRVRSLVRTALRKPEVGAHAPAAPLPFDGFDENRTSAPFVELLDDETLQALNALLPWKCFTVDSRGRRFGDRTKPWKNHQPRQIPDRRIVALDARFGLKDKRVLEVGCFEGVHTIGLCQAAKHVTAVDARVVNVAKTAVRCAFYDAHPTAFVCDVETWQPEDFDVDVVFHSGVLYHLRDPVRHIVELGRITRVGLLLDTHVAEEHEATESFVSAGKTYRYKHLDEVPRLPASGMYDHAKWLVLDDLVAVLQSAGFTDVEVLERRHEGAPRVALLARKATL